MCELDIKLNEIRFGPIILYLQSAVNNNLHMGYCTDLVGLKDTLLESVIIQSLCLLGRDMNCCHELGLAKDPNQL